MAEDKVSETGSISIFRLEEGSTYSANLKHYNEVFEGTLCLDATV
jgi:hypothetical protein